MSKSLLLAALDYSNVDEEEFNEWYDKEHLAERLRVPGFLNGERWINVANPRIAVSTYDLDSLDVLRSPPYLAFAGDNASPWSKRMMRKYQRLVRFAGNQILPGDEIAPKGAAALAFNAMDIPEEHDADFNAWYAQEHLPSLRAFPGVLSGRLIRASSVPSTHKYVAIYHLTEPGLPDSPEWKKVVDTPWSARMRPVFRNRVRLLCRRYAPAG